MVGISFYTFQSMSYVIDVYRGEQKPARSFHGILRIRLLLPYPARRPHHSRPRSADAIAAAGRRPLTDADGSRALMMIARGFIKKLVFADYLSVNLVDRAFELPRMFSSLEILIAVYAFAVQIYCDFSGYSDIAIGVAQLLGFKLPDNFNSPYRSESLGGILAAMAHLLLHLAARLHLLRAAFQPAGQVAALLEYAGHLRPGRDLAWRIVDVLDLGNAARLRTGGESCGGGALAAAGKAAPKHLLARIGGVC